MAADATDSREVSSAAAATELVESTAVPFFSHADRDEFFFLRQHTPPYKYDCVLFTRQLKTCTSLKKIYK